jgi:hypothetical protein
MASDERLGRIPRLNEPAPNFEAQLLSGETITLVTHPKPVALVFLRHLA